MPSPDPSYALEQPVEYNSRDYYTHLNEFAVDLPPL
jgi:hypothetical protein